MDYLSDTACFADAKHGSLTITTVTGEQAKRTVGKRTFLHKFFVWDIQDICIIGPDLMER